MDQLHEELKEPVEELEDQSQTAGADEDEPDEPAEPHEANEANTLISDEEKASRERQRDKNLINELHRADLDKDEDTATIVSSQGAIKHSKATGQCSGCASNSQTRLVRRCRCSSRRTLRKIILSMAFLIRRPLLLFLQTVTRRSKSVAVRTLGPNCPAARPNPPPCGRTSTQHTRKVAEFYFLNFQIFTKLFGIKKKKKKKLTD